MTTFVGPLTSIATAQVVRERPDLIVITSQGGQTTAGLDLAETIQDRGTQVRVLGFCASACAEYVFVAAQRRTVMRGGVLIFHDSATAVLASTIADLDPAIPALYRANAERELRLYRRAGVDVRLLLIPTFRMQPVCYELVRDALGVVRDLRFRARYAGWATTKQALLSTGLAFSGSIPRTARDLAEALAFKPLAPADFAFEDRIPDATFGQMWSSLGRVHRCGA